MPMMERNFGRPRTKKPNIGVGLPRSRLPAAGRASEVFAPPIGQLLPD